MFKIIAIVLYALVMIVLSLVIDFKGLKKKLNLLIITLIATGTFVGGIWGLVFIMAMPIYLFAVLVVNTKSANMRVEKL